MFVERTLEFGTQVPADQKGSAPVCPRQHCSECGTAVADNTVMQALPPHVNVHSLNPFSYHVITGRSIDFQTRARMLKYRSHGSPEWKSNNRPHRTITFKFHLERALCFSRSAINQGRGVQQKIAVKGDTSLACPLDSVLNCYLFAHSLMQ